MGVSVNLGNLLNGGRFGRDNGLKSTRQKLERQQECANKVSFFENQKENLKEMKCETLEDIERKLEMFHSYEDQIAAAKMAYNSEQMWHVTDEARERAEKMAEAAEKAKAKTPEERAEAERKEEAGGGILDEMLEMPEIKDIEETAESMDAQSESGNALTKEAEALMENEAEQMKEPETKRLWAGDTERTATAGKNRRFDTYA